MELNQGNLEKTDQVLLSMVRHHQDDQSPAKSYSCAFCKRGFSNAQALGGHMNIHRRDRAKLRESLEGVPSLGTPNKNADHDDHKLDEKIGDDKSPKRPCSVSSREDGACAQAKEDSTEEEKRKQLDSDSVQLELDLELRLGHERSPREKS